MTIVTGVLLHQRRRGAGRRAAAAAASAVAHVVVFAWVGLHAARLQLRPEPPAVTTVWLMERLPAPKERPAPTPAPTLQPVAARPAPKPAAPHAAKPPPAAAARVQTPRPTPAPLSAPLSAPAGAAVASGAAPPKSGPAWVGAIGESGVREALRTSVGCDVQDEALLRLTPAEQERCHQKIGQEARAGAGGFSGLDPLKRGRFDAQAAADDRRRADRTGAMRPGITPCGEGPGPGVGGSNLGAGCLSDSASAHIPLH